MKKKKVCASCFLFWLFLVVFALSSQAFLLGDLDGNAKITASDARMVLRAAAFLEELNENEKKTADVDGDGRITPEDARILLRISVSLDRIENYTDAVSVSEKVTLPVNMVSSEERLTPYEIYEKAVSFTAEVYVYNERGTEIAVASGFFLSQDGLFVTNYHVIAGAYFAKVKDSSGAIYNAVSVMGFDAAADLAILQTDAQGTTPAPLSADTVRVGDSVYVLGSTHGLTGTFTSGMVSSTDRFLEEMNNEVPYIQLSAPMAGGNSGGPVLNASGDVIGIAVLSDTNAQNLNFAIPVREIFSVDISSPVSISEVSKQMQEAFSGTLILSSSGVSLEKGGTAVFYAFAEASGDYSIACEVSNDSVCAVVGGRYGNLTVLYVSAQAASGSAQVTVYLQGQEQISKTFFVTLGGGVTSSYVGISGAVPDFGAYASAVPYACEEGTQDGKSLYAFRYWLADLAETGADGEAGLSGYFDLLAENGYVSVSVSPEPFTATFYQPQKEITVIIGLTLEKTGEPVLYVLIYQSS